MVDRFFAWRLPEQSPPPPPPPEEEEPGDSYIASRSPADRGPVRKRAEFVAEIESGSSAASSRENDGKT